MALHLNKFESPPPNNALCHFWLKLACGSGEESFSSLSNEYIFAISLLSTLAKGHGPPFEKNINPLHPRMLCVKFG